MLNLSLQQITEKSEVECGESKSTTSSKLAQFITNSLGRLVDMDAQSRGFTTKSVATFGLGSPTSTKTTMSPGVDVARMMEFEKSFATALATHLKLRPPSLFVSKWLGRPQEEAAKAKEELVNEKGQSTLEVLYLGSMNLRTLETTLMAERSIGWTAFSMTLVCLILILQFESSALAMMAIWQIVAAIPIAWLIYAYFIPMTAAISTLAIFVIIGIGADDLFVFTSQWMTLSSIHRAQDMDLDSYLVQRLFESFSGVGTALIATSLTTALGFFSLILCPLPVLASLGIFAGISVLVDLILTLSLWPSLLIYWYGIDCREKRLAKIMEIASSILSMICASHVKVHVSEEMTKPMREKIPYCHRNKLLTHNRRHMSQEWFCAYGGALEYKRLSFSLIMMMGSVATFLGWRAIQLPLPSRREAMLLDEHMFSRASKALESTEAPSSSAEFLNARGSIFFGLRRINRTHRTRFRFDQNRGELILEDSFHLTHVPTQIAMLRIDNDMRKESCSIPGCHQSRFIMPCAPRLFLYAWAEQRADEKFTALTPLSDIVRWLPSNDSSFSAQLTDWLSSSEGAIYRSQVGFIDGRVRFVHLSFVSTSNVYTSSHNHWLKLRELWSDFLDMKLADTPRLRDASFVLIHAQEQLDPSSSGKHLLPSLFAVSSLYPRLAASLILNLVGALVICCLLVYLATDSIRLALLSTTSVVAIICATLGSCETRGSSFGIKEMCGSAVVLGFSFDYSIHLVCAYCQACGSREARAAHAAGTMGLPMLAGSITTLGSMIFMLFTDFPFLIGLAKMILFSVLSSVFYALFFLLPLLSLVGPESERL